MSNVVWPIILILALLLGHRKHRQKHSHLEEQFSSVKIEKPITNSEIDRHIRYKKAKTSKRIDAVSWFTFVLVIVTGIQVWAFITSERSIVSLAGADISFEEKPTLQSAHFSANIKFRNSGKGAAATRIRLCVHAGPLPERPVYNISTDFCFTYSLGIIPEATDSGLVVQGDVPIAVFPKIKNGELSFYIFGYADFRDGFSVIKASRLGFCATLIKNATSANFGFNACQNENYVYRE